MQQHPVPQNISSYEFRLVGDMTLKQFLYLAGGIILAVIVYRVPLIAIIKLPAVVMFVMLGVFAAFVPINNRPFSEWLSAFIKAVYSPTEYIWNPAPPETPASITHTASSSSTSTNPINLGFASFLSSLFSRKHSSKESTLSSTPPITTPAGGTSTAIPSEPITVISFHPDHAEESGPTTTTTTSKTFAPQTSTPPPPTPAPQTVFQSQKPELPQPTLTTPPAPVSAPSAPVTTTPTIISKPQAPQIPTSLPSSALSASQLTAPTTPNILAGLVAESSGQALPGATIEIVDGTTGIPARALRTNRVGQFQIAIPLPKGSYIINTEKDGFVFDPVSIKVDGSIIQPVSITAKAA